MNKVLAIYFTGTGNSKKVIDLAASTLDARGFSVDIVDVCKDEVKDINEYDHLVISYPIYAFNAPSPITNYVKKLSKASKAIPCLVVKNSGEHLFWNNASSLYLMRLLKARNIIVKDEYHYLMPYSFVFRHTDYMAYRMKNALELMLPQDIDAYLEGKEHHYKRFILDRQFAFVFRIQRFGGRFNGNFYKVDEDKCVKCLKCIYNCPTGNISLKDVKIDFGKNCLMCQRCAMYCPTQAISVGMFKRWQVGKPYSFEEVTTFQKEKKPHFCAHSYKKYFEESEERARGAINE